MNNWKKATAVLATSAMLATALAGCASSGEEKKETEQTEGKAKVVVWSHWKEKEFDALKEVAEAWAKETGNEVELKIDESEFQQYATAARSGEGPDIMFGTPHDNLGTFTTAGLLDEMPADLVKEADYEALAFPAVTVEGKKVAFPVSMESSVLFYNTEKVKTPPTTWADFIKAASEGGFMYDVNNFYFNYGFLSAYGGYVFKNNGGTYDTKDIGLGNEGATKGYQLISDFVNKHKFMPADANGDIAKAKFTNKETAFYLSGPWDIPAMNEAKVPFGIMAFPAVEGGGQPKPFVGLQTAFVSSKSNNKKQSWDLLKYISEKGSVKFADLSARIPVLKSALADPKVKDNKNVSAIAAVAASGEPMPNIPAIQTVWEPEKNNLTLLTSGKATAEQVAKDVTEQVKQGIATQQ
ncbi:maltose ABC transporter substrate-binding protein [Tumebacillus sp. DT12]|uniref:Maltodextrin-binding protein n=1 Tax=Tumebacillus lacus TaxID=2995335 RepID=A0ABT3X142_9BACL|nr:maltose ABC transporter substrate-binding protein [Tumebacillus lacus]MCX7570648.1 maltose ABC transporter substrate-binding protein [Tumebacillus lacus]